MSWAFQSIVHNIIVEAIIEFLYIKEKNDTIILINKTKKANYY